MSSHRYLEFEVNEVNRVKRCFQRIRGIAFHLRGLRRGHKPLAWCLLIGCLWLPGLDVRAQQQAVNPSRNGSNASDAPAEGEVDPARVLLEKQLARRIDKSIVDALRFLSREQSRDGSWSIDAYGESTAATSLAVMAFLAAGHVPGEGPYGQQMERGIHWVIRHQDASGMLVHRTGHGPFYDHGISTLMLAEVLGMVNRDLAVQVRRALEKAVRATLTAQGVRKLPGHAGGWRYHLTSGDSDLSVTGWQLLSLRAAKNCGCDIPAARIDEAINYVKGCSRQDGGGFEYQPGSGATAVRTGTGVLCLEATGKHRAGESLDGAERLLARPLQYRDSYFFYGAYYCTVGLFKLGGKHWEKSRPALYSQLLDNQHHDGSWLPPTGPERGAGKHYCTTMAVLALAVEYQYLPIYQR